MVREGQQFPQIFKGIQNFKRFLDSNLYKVLVVSNSF